MATSIAGPGQLLADFQVTGLSAGQTGFSSISGVTNTSGNNSIQMTPNSVGSTQPLTNTYWHGLWFDYGEGVLNAGQVYPDIQMSFKVDEKDFSPVFFVDLTRARNMLPHRDKTEGRQFIMLGRSMLNAAFARNFGGNVPLEFTGPKISQGIDFVFSSTAGFTTGPTGTFQTPPTIKLWGDVYDATTWAWMVGRMGAWNGGISMSSQRRETRGLDPYSANHIVENIADLPSAFPQLPDGPGQGKVKVYRYMKFATPILAVSGTAPYVLSNLVTGINGKPGQVGQNNELAWAYSKNSKAVRISEFGRQPAVGTGYFGLTNGGITLYPNDTAYGVVDTVGNPRAWYGLNTTYTGIADQFKRLPRSYGWVPNSYPEEVIAGEDAGYFVAAQNGATIAASTDYTAIGGVSVEA